MGRTETTSASIHGSLVKNSQCGRCQGCHEDMLWIWKDAQLRGEGAPIKATPCSVSGCECKPTLGPSRREWLVHLPPPHRGLSQNPALTQASAPPLPPAPVALLLSVSMATTWAEPASPLPSPQPREQPERRPEHAAARTKSPSILQIIRLYKGPWESTEVTQGQS